MTKKETLHYETIQIQNQIRTIQGRADENINLEVYVSTRGFKNYADRRTKVELEKELAIAKQALEDAIKKAETERWLESEEGQAYVNERKDRVEQLYEENANIRRDSREYVRKIIRELLGNEWDVTRFSGGNMEIAIVEKYLENGEPTGLFGHEFEIYFGRDYKLTADGVKEERRWEMGYGTIGCFDLSSDSTRVQYLIGMSKFASDTTVVPGLKDYLHGMVEKLRSNEKLISGLEKEIKNPVIG